MSRNDLTIKNYMNSLLEDTDIEQLIIFIDTIPVDKIRRHLYILSEIFPNKIVISQKEFELIQYILTHNKFLEVESISDFIRAINIISFDELQQKQITDLIFSKIHLLSRYCHFELNMLITNIVNSEDFLNRIIMIVKDSLSIHLKTFLLTFISHESEFLQDCSQNKIDDLKKLLNGSEVQ
ncbi:hypothetical protein [Neisseria sp. 83E34]|uniref:hypothetical protein n=1 Tax=Neisseria sp. 83E34 TaxID=1692264 RepID=UPI0006CEA2E1|nr:hypothetical protein [Neisseria sp. 83E34]KPN70581.1 hypothetical protein AKG09_11335 [Neisseria sp. 83E34]